jgi:predicted YcjX-like family ATPase
MDYGWRDKRSFAESLEGIALDRVKNPDKGKGSDVLLITLLNANMPAKYRPQVAMNEDYAKELIFEWRKAAKEIAKEIPKEEGLSEDVEKTLTDILEKRKAKGNTDTGRQKDA